MDSLNKKIANLKEELADNDFTLGEINDCLKRIKEFSESDDFKNILIELQAIADYANTRANKMAEGLADLNDLQEDADAVNEELKREEHSDLCSCPLCNGTAIDDPEEDKERLERRWANRHKYPIQ